MQSLQHWIGDGELSSTGSSLRLLDDVFPVRQVRPASLDPNDAVFELDVTHLQPKNLRLAELAPDSEIYGNT
jgi:hypothetical protein